MRIPPISAGLSMKEIVSPGPYTRDNLSLNAGLHSRRQRRGAFDGGRVPGAVEFHQPPKLRKDVEAVTVSGFADSLAPPAAPGLRPAIRPPDKGETVAWRRAWLVGFVSSQVPPGITSTGQLPGRFLGQTLLIFGRQDLAGDRRGGLHNQPADFALQFGQHAVVVPLGGLAGAWP